MRQKILFVFLIVCSVLLFKQGRSQCRSFAKKICKPAFGNYIHDGNYNGIILGQGELAEFEKTFYGQEQYRMLICKEEVLPVIRFKIFDQMRKLLFDSAEQNYPNYWDFQFESSRTLIISLEVGNVSKPSEDPVSGCVAVLFGLELK